MSSAHRCKNSVASTRRNRGLRFSVSAANSAIVSLACASVASLVVGSHLSSRVFHSSWWMSTPYSVLATSVGIFGVPFVHRRGHANRAVAGLSDPGRDRFLAVLCELGDTRLRRSGTVIGEPSSEDCLDVGVGGVAAP